MADEADMAQAYEQAMIDRGIAAACRISHTNQAIEGGVIVCLDCDQPISNRRLQVQPHANRCVECQQEQERY